MYILHKIVVNFNWINGTNGSGGFSNDMIEQFPFTNKKIRKSSTLSSFWERKSNRVNFALT